MANIMSFNKDDHCQLYWIHRKSHTDILTQGYIGVSTNVESRFSVHKSCLKNKDSPVIYRSDFREAMDEDDLVFEVILKSTQEYCLYMENKLRPSWCIGWNIAAGGNGGSPRHGLYATREYTIFVTVGSRAREAGMSLSPEWAGEDGVSRFCKFYADNAVDGKLMFLPSTGVIGEDSVVFQTRKDHVRERNKVLNLDGEFYSVEELASNYGMRPNTLSTRLSRGMSLKTALKIEEKEIRSVVIGTRVFKYAGKLDDQELLKLVQLYEDGMPITEIGRIIGMDSGNISRIGRKLGLERPQETYVDFLGNICLIGATSVLTRKDYDEIKDMLMEGSTYTSIAKLVGITDSSMSSAIQRLKWKEYISGKEKS